MSSNFLPDDFDPNSGVALIAGKGRYPVVLAKQMQALGVRAFLVELEGETGAQCMELFQPNQRSSVKVGQVGKLLKILKKQGVGYAIMAGQVTPGKLFKGMHPDLKAILMLAKLKRRNAETLFGAIADEIEKNNVKLLDARAFMDACVVEEGVHCGKLKLNGDSVAHGIEIAREMARLDVGQGVVVSRGTVLAVEGYDGTDAMLRRCKEFNAKDKLFIKTSKPGQDFRFDVPVFGLNTIEAMDEGGIEYVGLEAGASLILDKDEVHDKLKSSGGVLFGYK